MYLKKLSAENVGPISHIQIDLPFYDGKPLPLVIVGANGSGKSTLLSFIVNALIGFKQQAFVDAEVERQRFYRLRSGRHIRSGTHWYHANAEFEEGCLSRSGYLIDQDRSSSGKSPLHHRTTAGNRFQRVKRIGSHLLPTLSTT